MKTRNILIFSMVAIFSGMLVMQQGCKKDKEEEPPTPTAPVYTNGEGEIGTVGGTVMIDDPASPLNGTKIVIPQGALNSTVTIKIEKAASNVILPGDSSALVVSFKPEGLSFSKPIEATIPFNGVNINQAEVYFWDTVTEKIIQMPIVSRNVGNKTIVFNTDHFSYYSASEYLLMMGMKMVYCNAELKIGALAYIDGWGTYEFGGGNFYPGLRMIPVRMQYWLNYGTTAKWVAMNYENPVYAIFNVKLYDGDFFLPQKDEMKLIVKREKIGDAYLIEVTKYNQTGIIYTQSQLEYSGFNSLESWLIGKPLVFYFNDFTFNPEKEYWIKMEWSLAQDADGTPQFTKNLTELNNKKDKRKPRDMELISSSDIYNSYILNEYVTGSAGFPTVTTMTITDITETSAKCSGSVTDEGSSDVTARGVCWSTSGNPTISDAHTIDGTGFGSFISNLTGLSGNTTYYVRAYATNNSGTSYGNQKNFTTTGSGTLPMVTTNSVTNVTETSATCGGDVTDQGSSSVTSRGVCWSISSNPTTSDSHTTDGIGTGSFTSNITGLSAITSYYVRAYATNSAGTAYGNQQTFTTESGAGGEPCPGIPTITDQRDGQVYPTVQIGSQCWLQKNMNYETGNSWCYDDNPAKCATYGRLYDWETALGVCPSGWHLPSDDEWKILEGTVDTQYGVGDPEWNDIFLRGYDAGKHLKSASGWYSDGNGDNTSGFTALPGGGRTTSGSFFDITMRTSFWSTTVSPSTDLWYRYLLYGLDQVGRQDTYSTRGKSARCLQD